MRDALEGTVMALLLLVALFVAYLLVVFLIIAGANFDEFIRILKSLWRSGALSLALPRPDLQRGPVF